MFDQCDEFIASIILEDTLNIIICTFADVKTMDAKKQSLFCKKK